MHHHHAKIRKLYESILIADVLILIISLTYIIINILPGNARNEEAEYIVFWFQNVL
jgi:hypothetical protein